VYLFLLALLVWLVASLFKLRYDYGAAYRVALYAASPVFVLSALLGLVQYHFPTFTATGIALVIVIVNLAMGRRKPGTA
jgi:hypothetical protein